MYRFFRDPGADGVGVAFSDATAADGSLLSLGGAHGAGGRAAGLGVIEADLGLPLPWCGRCTASRWPTPTN